LHQGIIRYRELHSDQLLQDLFWCINSENLLIENPPDLDGDLLKSLVGNNYRNEFQSWFHSLKVKPDKLIDFFDSNDQLIVGKYFERLLYFFFEHFSQYEIILAGKQLFDKKRTIGELDFVINDRGIKRILHIEVALKYYMSYRNTAKHSMWIGPNGSDTLAKKMRKFNAQLALSKSNEIKNIALVDDKLVLLKGYFFRHYSSNEYPHFYNPNIEDCSWMYLDEMDSGLDAKSLYCIVPKNRWLSFYLDDTLIFNDGDKIKSEIREQIARIGKGIMLAHVDATQNNVLKKLIVVPIKWPRL
jgi:hypothetical protein